MRSELEGGEGAEGAEVVRSQSSGGDLLHPPPLGQRGAAHRLQNRRDVPVESRVGGGHRTLEGQRPEGQSIEDLIKKQNVKESEPVAVGPS